jgi:hypothetical protein
MRAQDYLHVEEIAAHESAMQTVRDKTRNAIKELEVKLAREMQDMLKREMSELESLIEEQEKRVVLRRIYHEAPDDIIELIVRLLSNVDEEGQGDGGMNTLRLTCKRLMQVVESCATRLTYKSFDRTVSFLRRVSFPRPLVIDERCMRIEHITCNSKKLRSLEGCPDGLKSLVIHGQSLQSLEPLRRCTELDT